MLTEQKTINSIQMLRAIAAGMIVIFHATHYLLSRGYILEAPRIIDTCRAGVDLFFVISGFIMVLISDGKFGAPNASKDFLIRRAIRVVPAYWAYTILMAMLAVSFPHLVSEGKTVNVPHLLASLAFIPWENNIGYIKPVLSPGWTLNFEMYFYLIFGLLLALQRRYFLPLLTLILISGVLIGRALGDIPPILDVATSPLLMEFLLGCAIATYYKRNTYMHGSLTILLLVTGMVALMATGIFPTPNLPRQVKYGVPCAMIFVGVIYMERAGRLKVPPLLNALGNSSYSLYLSHIFTISAAGKIWFAIFGAMHYAFVIFASLMSIAVGHMAYLLFEKPVTSRLNKMYRRASQRANQ